MADYNFTNPYKHVIHLTGPHKEKVQFNGGESKTLSEYFLRYCPKYLTASPIDKPRIPVKRKNISSIRRSINSGVIAQNIHKEKNETKKTKIKAEKVELSDIGIGILSCNRLSCIKRLLTSISYFSDINKINLYVSDESEKNEVKEYLRSVDFINLLDNDTRLGIVGNTNRLLKSLVPYKYKLILNDDVEITSNGWEKFYFDIMNQTGYHHFCYRQYGIYGASHTGERSTNIGNHTIKTISSKPHGAVLAFDDEAFRTVGYYDWQFPKYGMAHVDWSNRISLSGIQPSGFHDVGGSNKLFKIHDENSATDNSARIKMLSEAKTLYNKISKDRNRIYIQDSNDMYDFIIWMATYNRTTHVNNLLDDIKKESQSYKVKIVIYDDCSTDDYTPILQKFDDLDISYTRLKERHGKKKYWALMTRAMKEIAQYSSKYYIKIDDDFRLHNNFFSKCVGTWNCIDDPKKVLLNYYCDKRAGERHWTSFEPHKVQFGPCTLWKTGWVDCFFFSTRRLYEILQFHITKINKRRWSIGKENRSSGVGADISNRLVNKWSMYQVSSSLVDHHGNDDSKMHGDYRKECPLIATTDKDKITVSIASIMRRSGALRDVVKSLLNQCDTMNIYLHGYNEIPYFLLHDKINVMTDKKYGDRGDADKFFLAAETDGYCFTCDDDLIYPPDYVNTMIKKIEQYRRKCCVGVHGLLLKDTPVTNFYTDRYKAFHYNLNLNIDQPVHILGTGVMAYHSDTINISLDDFELPNMADIWFGLQAQKQKVGMICISHRQGWVKNSPLSDGKSIHKEYKYNCKPQTDAVNRIKWKIHKS